jgi:hypothetical protein
MFEFIDRTAATRVAPTLIAYYHSDDYFVRILSDLVDIGFRAIEPSQPDCLDLSEISRRFGVQIASIGSIGTAAFLHHGSPESIAQEVRTQISMLGLTGLRSVGKLHYAINLR